MSNEPMEVIEGEVVDQPESLELVVVNEINKAHEAFINSMQRGLQHAIHCGELLNAQKSRLSHGEWMPWVVANCAFTISRATDYMKLARNFGRGQNLPDEISSVREALRLLEPPKETKQLPSRTLANGEEEVLPRSSDYAPSTDPYRRVVQQEAVDEEPKVNAGFSWMKDPLVEDALDGIKSLSMAIKLLDRAPQERDAARQILRLFRDTLTDLVGNLNRMLGDK